LEYSVLGKKIRKLLKDLSGPSPLVNLFFKTKTKKITVVQYQNENEKRRRERRPIKTPPHALLLSKNK